MIRSRLYFRNNKISAAKSIKIVFPEDDFGKEQAEEFRGIVFNRTEER